MSQKLHREHGATMTAFIIVMPFFIIMILAMVELGLMYQAKQVLDMASLAAARTGAINHARVTPMKDAAAIALAPLTTHKPTKTDLGMAMLKSEAWARLGGAVQIEVLNPSAKSFSAHGLVENGIRQIPNDNLGYRNPNRMGGADQNIQDANILKIKVTYKYKLQMPLMEYIFIPIMSKNVTQDLFGKKSLFPPIELPSELKELYVKYGFHVDLVSYATVRMQSPAFLE